MHQTNELRTQIPFHAYALPITFSIGLIVVFASLLGSAAVATPILGNYPDSSLPLSGDTAVTPDAAPIDATRITVSTSTDFKGTLTGDRTTGDVRVTDAYPAGSYTVMVTAFDSAGATATKTFTLAIMTPETCLPVSFASAINYHFGSYPRSVAVGDFNRDGQQDLAVGDVDSDAVAIFIGDGAGNFSDRPKRFPGGGNTTDAIAVGDFNGDGRQDLAVANRSAGTVSILLGNAGGGFGSPASFASGVAPSFVAVGDFNGDGKPDLAAVNNAFPGSVAILLGNGRGRFRPAMLFDAGNNSVALALGDFNSDGNQDLAVTSRFPDGVEILLGDGRGRFSRAQLFLATSPVWIASGDFNGDGLQDLATTNLLGTVSILLGDGAGNFSSPTDFPVGDQLNGVAVGDFNGDGLQDLAVSSNSEVVAILLGDGVGSFGDPIDFPLNHQPGGIAVGDFNNDGQQDLAVANGGSKNVSVLLRDCP